MSSILDIETLKSTMRVTSITSSFSSETKNQGVKSSSFVSYTVKSEREDGWNLEEARLVEALLAERVSKDLYADLAARQQAPLSLIKDKQQSATHHYGKITENLIRKINEDTPVDIKALVRAAEEVGREG
jgi:hypothetical protein